MRKFVKIDLEEFVLAQSRARGVTHWRDCTFEGLKEDFWQVAEREINNNIYDVHVMYESNLVKLIESEGHTFPFLYGDQVWFLVMETPVEHVGEGFPEWSLLHLAYQSDSLWFATIFWADYKKVEIGLRSSSEIRKVLGAVYEVANTIEDEWLSKDDHRAKYDVNVP